MIAKHILRGLLLAGVLSASTAGSKAEPFSLPASDFGKSDIQLRESVGGALTTALKAGNVFFRIGRLAESDRIRQASRAIVRLDFLYTDNNGEEKFGVCTASVVSPTHILTNYHCIPGHKGGLNRAAIVVDYLQRGADDAPRIPVEVTTVDADPDLDFAVVRLARPLPEDFPRLPLKTRATSPNERLLIIHHPAGQPKMMTQFGCLSYSRPSQTDYILRHVCDTLPGSSGGIIFDPDSLLPVAIHHSGGLNKNDSESFNRATRFSHILKRVRAVVGAQPTTDQPIAASPSTPATNVTTKTDDPLFNDISNRPMIEAKDKAVIKKKAQPVEDRLNSIINENAN